MTGGGGRGTHAGHELGEKKRRDADIGRRKPSWGREGTQLLSLGGKAVRENSSTTVQANFGGGGGGNPEW